MLTALYVARTVLPMNTNAFHSTASYLGEFGGTCTVLRSYSAHGMFTVQWANGVVEDVFTDEIA